MAQQNLDFGTPSTDDGEFLETAMPKVQANFTELYGKIAMRGFKTIAGTSYTLIADDFNKVLVFTNASPITLTVNKDINKAEDFITILQAGAGIITVVNGTDVP